MRTCPACNRQYEGDDYVKCPYDGSNLVNMEDTGADPMIGAQLGDSYQVTRVIGEGGMGRVYEARHTRLSKRYAIKVLHPQFATDKNVLARFDREAKATSEIGHENILDVMDFNATPEGMHYIVTEFLEGRDLARAMSEDGIFKIPRTLYILHQVARALSAAHARTIVHRDMKPENIFLVKRFDTEDFVKVLDFGISKVRSGGDRLTQTGQIIGTPHYMSPEQAQGELNLDHRSDVYSVGAIMYEMFTGYLPFQEDTVQKILVMLLTEDPPPPRTRRPDLPEDIEAMILKCIAKDPNQRYQSMDEILAGIQELWQRHASGESETLVGGTGMTVQPQAKLGSLPSSPGMVPPSSPAVTPVPGTAIGGTPAPGSISSPGTPGAAVASAPTTAPPAASWGPATDPQGQKITMGQSVPPPSKKGAPVALIIIIVLLLLGGGGGAVWFFVLRDKGGGEAKEKDKVAQAGMDAMDMDAMDMDAMDMDAMDGMDGMDAMGMDAMDGMGAMDVKVPDPPDRKKPTKGMVLLKGGTFTMGRKGGSKKEGPPQKGVKVADYYLDATEVSRTEYARYLAGPGKTTRSPWPGDKPPAGTGKLPVVNVTYLEAKAYCKAQGKRLPSEAEWEYAARGPTHDKLFPWGNEFDPSKVVCSVAKPSQIQPVRSGTPIGGLYHLSGNVWEWVADQYKPYPGSKAGRAFGTQYVIRGGGAESKKTKELTATFRVFNYGHKNPKTKKLVVYKFLGFRCARDAKP